MADQAPRVEKLDMVEYETRAGKKGKGIVIGLGDSHENEDPDSVVLLVWDGGKELEIRESEATVFWSIQKCARQPPEPNVVGPER